MPPRCLTLFATPYGPALQRDHAVFGQMATNRTDHVGVLAHEHLPGPEQHRPRLALFAPQRNQTHGRTRPRLGNHLGAGHVVLLALYVRLHILRWDQPHFMAQLRQLPAPAMRRRAGLHRHDAGRLFRQKVPEPLSRHLLPSRPWL